jgi:hypothetical protein
VPQPFVTPYEIVVVPTETGVTTPELTVATPMLELVHAPPEVALAKVVVEPIQTDAVPEIDATVGNGLTVIANVV